MAERNQQQQPTRQTQMQTPSPNPMVDLRQQMDRLFNDFANAFRLMPFSPFGAPDRDVSGYEPFGGVGAVADVRFEVSESDKEIEVSAELPGMTENDVDIQLANNVLTIKGEKKAEEERKEKNYYLSERRYGAFQRAFRLPEGIDEDNISASFDSGVLRISLPKREETQGKQRQIQIKGK